MNKSINASKAKKLTNDIIKYIKDYYQKNNLKGAVLGISGGKDSAVVAGLMCKAIGAENVVGLTLPCHSKEKDAIDAKLVSKKFGFRLINIDLTNTYDTLVKSIDKDNKYTEEEKCNSNINVKPRLRMSTVYYMAALLSKTEGGTYIVPGTSNACEVYVGYFTKGGDSVFDIGPIFNLTIDEVLAVGAYIGVPEKVLYKTPDDGLSGKSDEEKLGVKYSDITKVIRKEKLDKENLNKINRLHNNSKHKLKREVYKKK